MKRILAILMTISLALGIFAVNASALELDLNLSIPSAQDIVGERETGLYVKANPKEGLDFPVTVTSDVTALGLVLYLPGSANANKLCFSWNDKNLTVSRNGKTYESGKAPIAAPGKSISYTLKNGVQVSELTIRTMQGSPRVEAMSLTVDERKGTIQAMNSDADHETSCYGKVLFHGKDKYMSIKGRGNSTWIMPKKPYNITIYDDAKYESKDKVQFIDGVKTNKWALTANYLDNSLLRNKLAMDLAKDMGIGLDSVFIDVWMNGEYLGNYLLTPKKEWEVKDGGYQLENDNYVEPEGQFKIPGMFEIDSIPGVSILGSGYHNRMTITEVGDDAKAAGLTNKNIKKHFLKGWDALLDYDSEEYQKYFDLDSWAKMFLMYEVSKTYDCYAGSLMMHRDGLTAKDKLIAGPAWDYDVSFGRTLHKFFVGVSEPMQVNAEGWYNDSIGLELPDEPVSLLQEFGKHKSFMQRVAKVYKEYQWAFHDLSDNVTRQHKLLKKSAAMNNVRWSTHLLGAEYVVAPNTMAALGTGKYQLHYEVTTTWSSYCRNLREYCNKRVLWLTDHLT
ncbi:MAG: CotH kinase family protein [Clostridia bacterium]|nr:CotH kinase family protein [Clostridia bacterium]